MLNSLPARAILVGSNRNPTQSQKGFYLLRCSESPGMARFKAQMWSPGLSVTDSHDRLCYLTLISLSGSFSRVKKMVSGTCRPRDLLALGLEEESLGAEFWLSLLVVACPLLSLCHVGGGGGRP